MDDRAFLLSLFEAAVASVSPHLCVPQHLPKPPSGRTLVLGAGKGAAAMARAVEENFSGEISGLAITRYGHGFPTRRIEIVEAAHPVPDEAGEQAARRMLEMAGLLGEDDLLLFLVSGGGSALAGMPAEGVSLSDKRDVNRALLKSPASISEINCVRKHLSAFKGGRLARAAYPARVVSLIISDVPGDDPAIVASGPTVPDPTTREDARRILERYRLSVPANVLRHLNEPASESPKPGDPYFARVDNIVIARAQDALRAAARHAKAQGVEPILLGDAIEGLSRDVAREHAALARARMGGSPCVLISGGETTVDVTGNGRGGRNSEYALALAVALEGLPISAIAADTDGIDGSEDNAGALVFPDSMARARALGIDPQGVLANNNSYELFARLEDLVTTGPTRTNVNDFRAILIGAR